MVHDLGHGPFSHAFEEASERFGFKTEQHEETSIALITDGEVADQLNKLGSGFAKDVADVLRNEDPTIYGAVVSSQFDADRLDYMQRDRLMCGTGIGVIDFEWLIANLRVATVPFGADEKAVGTLETLVMGPKGVMAVEAFVVGLFHLYPTVYLHKATRGAEKLFTELLARVVELALNDATHRTGLDERHPLVKFARNPNVAESIDVREEVLQTFGLGRLKRVDKVCAQIALKIGRWRSNVAGGVPRVLTDDPERVLYKPGPVNRILVQTSKDGPPVDIVKTSAAVRATRPFKGFRVYYRDGDFEAEKKVRTIIRGETEYGRRQ